MKTTFNTEEAKKAQKALCEEKQYPHFAPYSGECYNCNKNIYEAITKPSGHISGKTVEEAGSSLITGCPHCHSSYCD